MGLGTNFLFHSLQSLIRILCTKFQVIGTLYVEVVAPGLCPADFAVLSLSESQS